MMDQRESAQSPGENLDDILDGAPGVCFRLDSNYWLLFGGG